MSRVKRQKLDRSSNAAYIASQPLFSTLKNATTTSLPAQEAHLTTARDVVQTLHVKIADNDNTHNDISRHQKYMDSVVKAWESAVDSYCEIFTEMVKITGPEPSEGREEGRRHLEFVAMLDSVKKAKSVVEEFRGTENSGESREDDHDEGSGIEVASEKNAQGKRKLADASPLSNGEIKEEEPQPKPQETKPGPPEKKSEMQAQKPSILDQDTRYDKTGTKVLWQKRELKVPYKSLSPAEMRAWDTIKRSEKRRKAKQATRARGTAGASNAETRSQSATAANGNQGNANPGAHRSASVGVATIQFEDVSEEVERRLKAKADKRAAEKAKKGEKKRKRESEGSNVATIAQEENPAAADEDNITVTPKPLKKKPRRHSAEGSEIQVNGNGTTKNEADGKSGKLPKRKQHEEEAAAEEGSKQATKKRKKAKM
ncbi:hypothetical protein DOTSEDRAFT_21646 [Lecanosticta acicola]|uniref:Uncharacterized protein n=1 Tax=Lecanosticta acicola TaxID=111012 RepID=A0AAI9EA43_9PEZI|nr:hypothetical protein DOTSEDRAFT_21646 [Lecanosticta acicola]